MIKNNLAVKKSLKLKPNYDQEKGKLAHFTLNEFRPLKIA